MLVVNNLRFFLYSFFSDQNDGSEGMGMVTDTAVVLENQNYVAPLLHQEQSVEVAAYQPEEDKESLLGC